MKITTAQKLARSRSLMLVAAALILVSSASAQYTETVLARFTTKGPQGSLIWDNQGNLYGTTEGFRYQLGTVFELENYRNKKWVYKVLYRFTGGLDGAYPQPGLVFDDAGNLYGTTLVGGVNPCNWSTPATCGTVFELSPTSKGAWTQKVVYSFPSVGGAIPSTGLISDGSGNLYGATVLSGPRNFDGTIFKLTKRANGTWGAHVLHTFTSADTFGMSASGPLAFDNTGNLYGITNSGGAGPNCPDLSSGCGTVFTLSHLANGGWKYKSLYSFCSLANCSDGAHPAGVVVLDEAGNLYGTALGPVQGLPPLSGNTVFELSPGANGSWTFNLLYTFCSAGAQCADGVSPSSGLVRDATGNLYGPTVQGGANLQGTVFKLSPDPTGNWDFQTLYSFCAEPECADGYEPAGVLTLDSAANIYGTTAVSGVIFKLAPD